MELNKECHCCLLRPPAKDLKTLYTHIGITEIYSEMLEDCFKIQLLESDGECGICEVCVGRLRDASDFKQQVQRCQATLRARMETAWRVKKEESSVKSEVLEDDAEVEFLLPDEIKSETLDPLPNDDGERKWEYMLDLELKIEEDKEVVTDSCPPFDHRDESPHHTIDQDSIGACSDRIDPFKAFTGPKTKPRDMKRIIKTVKWPVSCLVCTEEFHSKDQFNRHMVAHTSENLYVCDVCSEQFTEKQCLIKHSIIHFGCNFHCDVCDETFVDNNTLKQHKINHPRGSKITKTRRVTHKRIHTKEKAYGCDICSKTFITKHYVKKHKLIHMRNVDFACDICSKLFRHEHNLKLHKLTHVEQKPQCCEICNKIFSNISRLKIHKNRMHIQKEPLYCEVCGLQLSSSWSLNEHRRAHTGEKPFACDVCQKVFSRKTYLTVHMRAHTGQKPYSCEVCMRQFADFSSCRRHKFTHSENRPTYSCEICNKQFVQKQKLNTHKLIHTGEKPYSCEVCGKYFRDKSNLRQHMEIHVKGRSYACELCSRAYATKESLRQHKRGCATKKVEKLKAEFN